MPDERNLDDSETAALVDLIKDYFSAPELRKILGKPIIVEAMYIAATQDPVFRQPALADAA